jgi:hypothetical protein
MRDSVDSGSRRSIDGMANDEVSMIAAIRKIVVQLDEIRMEMGRAVDPPTRRAVAMAVIANPFAGQYAENLDALTSDRRRTWSIARRQVRGCTRNPARSRRTATARRRSSGEAGELEHAAAICIRRWALRCGRRYPRVRRWCRQPRKWVAWARPSTYRSATRRPPSCAVTSMPSRRAFRRAAPR